jgi:hypothetical protein
MCQSFSSSSGSAWSDAVCPAAFVSMYVWIHVSKLRPAAVSRPLKVSRSISVRRIEPQPNHSLVAVTATIEHVSLDSLAGRAKLDRDIAPIVEREFNGSLERCAIGGVR